MSTNCKDFRRRLRAALEGGLRGESASLEAVRPLSWHEHLFTCNECRDLLETEEALEEVLASLPAPVLPKKLAKRILERLATERLVPGIATGAVDLDNVLTTGDSVDVPTGLASRVLEGLEAARRDASVDTLDILLSTMPSPQPPTGLAARVLDGVRHEREAALDALLDLVPAPRIPEHLGDEILNALDEQRSASSAAPILRPSFGALHYVAAIAATLVVAFGAWRLVADDKPVGGNSGERNDIVRDDKPDRGTGRELTTESVAARDIDHAATDTGSPETAVEVTPAIDVVEPKAAPNATLLASLDVLEDWELLMSDDIDMLLGSLDEADAELLFLIEANEDSSSLDTEEG